jgi:hypothetical protein
VGFFITLLLVVAGLLLLLLSLAGVAFGAFMALDQRNREVGAFFAIWWVPGIAAALGLLMRDSVTFAVGAFCFLVAGAALVVDRLGAQRPERTRRTGSTSAKKRSSYESAKQRLLGKVKKYRKVVS